MAINAIKLIGGLPAISANEPRYLAGNRATRVPFVYLPYTAYAAQLEGHTGVQD